MRNRMLAGPTVAQTPDEDDIESVLEEVVATGVRRRREHMSTDGR
jgi:hypothetical protein